MAGRYVVLHTGDARLALFLGQWVFLGREVHGSKSVVSALLLPQKEENSSNT